MSEVQVDVRLAAYCVVVDESGRVLLARWNESVQQPLWSVPGGGVELAESFEEAAVREVREETGYDVELVRLLGVDAPFFLSHERLGAVRDRHAKQARVVYEARVVGGEMTSETDGSTDEARWFSVADVTELARVGLVDVALRMAGLLDPQAD